MPKLSPLVVVISLGQQVKGLVKGKKACCEDKYYCEEDDEEEDFEEGEDFFTGSLPSIVDSLGNYLNHNFEVWDVLRPIWITTAMPRLITFQNITVPVMGALFK